MRRMRRMGEGHMWPSLERVHAPVPRAVHVRPGLPAYAVGGTPAAGERHGDMR